MNKEYKKVYDLVRSLKYKCDYIKFKNALYTLNIYSEDYNIFKGKHFKVFAYSLEELKQEIKEQLKPKFVEVLK